MAARIAFPVAIGLLLAQSLGPGHFALARSRGPRAKWLLDLGPRADAGRALTACAALSRSS
jgi:hypothetical protein